MKKNYTEQRVKRIVSNEREEKAEEPRGVEG